MDVIVGRVYSESYDTASWGEDCFLFGEHPGEPCWGRVEMLDDGERFDGGEDGVTFGSALYACEGHFDWPRPYRGEGV